MDFSLVCRTCLRGESLNPIFKINDDHDKYSTVIYRAIGIQVQYNDNLPQNMCTNCINKLNSILKFRKLCRDTESKLLNIVKENKFMVIQKITKKNVQKKNHLNIDIYNKLDATIKAEINDDDLNNETDLDDDMPLKMFLVSKESIKTKIKSENDSKDENMSNYSDIRSSASDVTDNKIKEEPSFNYTKLHNSSNKDISHNEIIEEYNTVKHSKPLIVIATKSETESTRKTSNKYYENTELTDINNSNSITTELPYELITDPVSEKVTRVLCKLCNKELSIRSIDSHMTRRHPGADERKVKCDLCDSYIMKEKINRHRVMMHGSGGFKCGYCKSEFETKQKLIDHVDTCSGKKKKRKVNESGRELRECDICHKVMQKASLRMHKAVKHAGLRPVCEHCGKSFGNKFRLNEHYRAKHGYEKFQCSYCEFQSAGVMAMRNHERRHRGEKPFVCEECGAKFHAAYLLTQHKHSHRTEKLVKCDLCPATFKANNSLHMHKLTCHSSAMYRCVVCCRSYKCRHYAVKHVRHVHRYSGPTPPLVVVTSNDILGKDA